MVARTGRAKGGKGKGLPNGGAGGTGGAGGAGGAAVPAPEPAADQVDAAECKFKHLLEPIRDLAINWNIDMAQVRSARGGGAARVPFVCACVVERGRIAGARFLAPGAGPRSTRGSPRPGRVVPRTAPRYSRPFPP